jgi:Recombination endonuclease VII
MSGGGGVVIQASRLHGPIDMTSEQRAEVADWRKFYRMCERTYGTPQRPFGEREYVALYVAQDGRCAICRRSRGRDPREPLAYVGRKRKPRRLGVDHNHLTGLVRGLLCSGSVSANTCNRLVARYDADALERAARYLREPPAVGVLSGVPDEAYRYGKPPRNGWQAPGPIGPGCVCDGSGRPCPRHGVVV